MGNYVNDYLIVGEKESLERLQTAMAAAEQLCKENSEKSYMKPLFAELGFTQGLKKLLLRDCDIDWTASFSVRYPVTAYDDGRLKCHIFGITEYTESSDSENLFSIKRLIKGIGDISFRMCGKYGSCRTNNTNEFPEKYYVVSEALEEKGIKEHYFADDAAVLEVFKSVLDVPEKVQFISQLEEWCEENDVDCHVNEIEHQYSLNLSDYNYGLAVRKMLRDAQPADEEKAVDQLYCAIHNNITCCISLQHGSRVGMRVRYQGPALLFEYPIDKAMLSKYILDFGCPSVKDEYFLGYPDTDAAPIAANKDAQALFLEYLQTDNVDTLRLSAQSGYLYAMKVLWEKLSRGEVEEKTEGLEWLSKASDLGDAQSQYELAIRLLDDAGGNPEDEDLKYAVSLLRSSAEAGYLAAVKELYKRAKDLGLSDDEYERWLNRAVELNDDDALPVLAEYEYHSANYERALNLYLRHQKNYEKKWNRPYIDQNLAAMYYQGLGTATDFEKAAYFYSERYAVYQRYLRSEKETIDPAVWKSVADAMLESKLLEDLNRALRQCSYNKAVRLYQQLGYCPDEKLNDLAWAFCEIGNYKEALPLALKAVAYDQDPNVLDTLATAYQGIGKYDLALSTFEQCRKMYVDKNDERRIAETESKIDALRIIM